MPPKIMKRDDVPLDLVAVIFYCATCASKHTYGRDFFLETDASPEKCPNCSSPYNQDDQVHRMETDTFDDLLMKRDDLRRKRGEAVPVAEKPEDPEEIKRMRVRALRDEAERLERGEDPRGPRLGR